MQEVGTGGGRSRERSNSEKKSGAKEQLQGQTMLRLSGEHSRSLARVFGSTPGTRKSFSGSGEEQRLKRAGVAAGITMVTPARSMGFVPAHHGCGRPEAVMDRLLDRRRSMSSVRGR